MQTEIEAKFLDINPEEINVTEEEIDGWESITFVPVPDWLEIKRK